MLKRFIIFTYSGEGLPVAEKLQTEGREVHVVQVQSNRDILTPAEKYKAEDPEERKRRTSSYTGIVDKLTPAQGIAALNRMPQSEREKTFLFFDMNCLFKYSEMFKDKGFHGNFATLDDRLQEADRNAAKDFVRKNFPDIKVAEVQEFKKKQEAEKFLNGTQDIWVLKGLDDDAKTVVPDTEDPELAKNQILEALEKDKSLYEKSGFILEMKIPNVIELTPQKVYYDGQPVFTDMDIENKRIGAGDIGQMTGCAMDLVFPTAMDCKINKMAFPKIVDQMARKHKGMFVWDMSILFDPKTDTPYFGEFCSNRCGYNAFYTELCQLKNVGDYFEAMAKGKNPYEGAPMSKFGASVRLFNRRPDSDIPKMTAGGSRVDFTNKAFKNLWLMDVKMDKGDLVTAGYSKDLAVVTGCGDTPEAAAKQAYKHIKAVSFEEMEYRPELDYLSRDYFSSILNRYDYALKNKLI